MHHLRDRLSLSAMSSNSKQMAAALGFFVIVLFMALLGLVFTAPSSSSTLSEAAAAAAQLEAAKALRDTLHRDADFSVPPCHNFYQHVCGGWLQRHRNVTASDPSIFGEVEAEIDARIRKIADDGWPIVHTWYAACMDGRTRAAAGLQPVWDAFGALLDATTSNAQLELTLAALHRAGVGAFWQPVVAPLAANSSLNALYLDFVDTLVPVGIYAAQNTTLLEPYNEWALAVATAVLGSDAAARTALSIETQLLDALLAVFAEGGEYEEVGVAAVPAVYMEALLQAPQMVNTSAPSSSSTASSSSTRPTSSSSAASSSSTAPASSHSAPSSAAASSSSPRPLSSLPSPILVPAPDFLSRVWRIATVQNDMAAVRLYLRLRCAVAVLAELPRTTPPSAVGCVQSLRRWLAPVLSHYYAAAYSSPAARAGATSLLEEVLAAFSGLLHATHWMDSATRDAALEKLAAIRPLIAFPDRWDTVIQPELVHANEHLANALRVLAASTSAQLAELWAARQKYEWQMAAFDVNAYYDPTANDIVFPAGIVQPPFFNTSAPLAANYGGLGTVMGHEVGHAFDNTGRLFDADGDERDWWTAQSSAAYEVRADCVAAAYNGLAESDAPGVYVDGNVTLGENWADLTGLKAAYNALMLALRALGAEEASTEEAFVEHVFGYGQAQLFFRSWAHHWCAEYSAETSEELALSDTHAPAEWRVNMPALQSEEFRAAFGCRRPRDVQQCELFRKR